MLAAIFFEKQQILKPMTMLLPMAMAIHKSLYTRLFLRRKRQPDTRVTDVIEDLKKTCPHLFARPCRKCWNVL